MARVCKRGGWETGSSRFPQEASVEIYEGVMPEPNPTANDRKRGPYHALSGKWVDSKVKKESHIEFATYNLSPSFEELKSFFL